MIVALGTYGSRSALIIYFLSKLTPQRFSAKVIISSSTLLSLPKVALVKIKRVSLVAEILAFSRFPMSLQNDDIHRH